MSHASLPAIIEISESIESDPRTIKQDPEHATSENFTSMMALREFTMADRKYHKSNEVLVEVSKQRFNKLCDIRKITNDKEMQEFCCDPVSKRSKLFQLSGGNGTSSNVKRLPLSDMKKFCGNQNETIIRNFGSSRPSPRPEVFTVQKVKMVARKRLEYSLEPLELTVEEDYHDQTNFNVTQL